MSKPFFATLGILAIGIASYATTYMRLETNDGRISKVDVDNVSQIDFVEENLAPGELSPEIEAKLETKTYTFRGVSFKMIYVKGGSLNMGAQPSDNTLDGYDSKATWAESPVHKVTLSSYAIGETEVTQALWNTLNISPNERLDLRSDLIADNKPIFFINQELAKDFIDLLNVKMHNDKTLDPDLQFALPTEAQWEYAARGGVNSKGYYYSGSNVLSEVGEKGPDFSPVKSFMPNELGIYDMTGNACELTLDYWSSEGYITTTELNPINEVEDEFVVFRGGMLGAALETDFRLTSRLNIPKTSSPYFMSFRMVLVPIK